MMPKIDNASALTAPAFSASAFSAPVGVGLRPVHYPHLRSGAPVRSRWFEAISENYMDSEGRPIQTLESVRSRFPVALHGVSMSIGRAEGVQDAYLHRLKALIGRIDPFLVSDHLCWTGPMASNLHDLLPLPYSNEAVQTVTRQLDHVQNYLGRSIAIENISCYLTCRESTMTEWEFIAEIARRSGCRILLDLNNVYVNSVNQNFDPNAYVDAIPTELIAQVHLAGYTDMGTHLFDTHSRPVSEGVWALYRRLLPRIKNVPILLEWDEAIPEFAELEKEAAKADDQWKAVHQHAPEIETENETQNEPENEPETISI